MGINDRCAIGACNNARKYPEKYVIKQHISATFNNGGSELRFHSCKDPKNYAKWGFCCNRKQFQFKKHHVICSNHFKYGRPTNISPHPTMYLKGYDGEEDADEERKRKAPKQRSTPVKKCKKSSCTSDDVKKEPEKDPADVEFSVSLDLTSPSSCSSLFASPTRSSHEINDLFLSPVNSEMSSISIVDVQGETSKISLNLDPVITRLSWDCIKDRKNVIKLYTGCATANTFIFIADHVRPKRQKLQYYKGDKSSTIKQYQFSPVKPFSQNKPGPSRFLEIEDEILMTLMRIRLDAPVADLAFRFGISAGHASNIITTFLLFLSLELEELIYWPTPDETLSYKHNHFAGTFNKCEGIGDCTEQWIEHSKNVGAQYQTYSTYKSHNTLKKLIFCTKSGSISYISPAYAGSCTDRFITEDTNVAKKFHPNFIVLFDKGFNVQDLFLSQRVTCVLPPFVRNKRQFTRSEVYHGKRIARARIHIERVMGRLKEFRLLKNILPISMIDMCDHIWIIAGAIVNMQPPLVK